MVREGYAKTEIGVIPEDWKVLPVTRITSEIFLGLTSKVDYVDNNGIPLVRATDIAGGKLSLEKVRTISLEQHRGLTKYRKAKRNDILISKSGSLGVCAIVDVDDEFSIYESIIVLQPMELVNAVFLLWLMRDKKTQARMVGEKVGSSVAHLNIEMFRKLVVQLPPPTEQQAIAEALSDVDGLIDGLEKLIAKKQAIKTATMQQLLTGKTRLPGFGEGKGYKQTELGKIPEDWEVKLLPDICRFRGGKAHEQYISDLGRFVCVNSKFISTDGKIRKNSNANFCCAKRGDILMVMSDLPNGKALAKAYLANQDDLYAVNQRVCALTPYSGSHDFLFYILNRNPYFLKFDDGVNQTHLLNHVFQKCPICLPPTKAEQDSIATILCDMETEIIKLEAKLTKIAQIKQGMMQELLTGRTRLI